MSEVIDCKFSREQLDILETCLEVTIQDDFFAKDDKLIAEVLLEDVRELKLKWKQKNKKKKNGLIYQI